jgi:hypothetical protein
VRYLLITGAVLMWMAPYFSSDGFKSGREFDWVQGVTDFGRCVIGCIAGLCLLSEIFVFLGLRQKALALYRQASQLLVYTLGGRVALGKSQCRSCSRYWLLDRSSSMAVFHPPAIRIDLCVFCLGLKRTNPLTAGQITPFLDFTMMATASL